MSERFPRQKPQAWSSLHERLESEIARELRERGLLREDSLDARRFCEITGMGRDYAGDVSKWLRGVDCRVGLKAALQIAEALGLRIEHSISVDPVAAARANRRLSRDFEVAA